MEQLAACFRKGDNVQHVRKSDGLVRNATVQCVHTDDLINGVYYTIKLHDSNVEMQTVHNRLRAFVPSKVNTPAEDKQNVANSWGRVNDPRFGVPYYFNYVTGESTWLLPSEVEQSQLLKQPIHEQSVNKQTWFKVDDVKTGKPYYFNTETGVSTWEQPEEYLDLIQKNCEVPVNNESSNVPQLTSESEPDSEPTKTVNKPQPGDANLYENVLSSSDNLSRQFYIESSTKLRERLNEMSGKALKRALSTLMCDYSTIVEKQDLVTALLRAISIASTCLDDPRLTSMLEFILGVEEENQNEKNMSDRNLIIDLVQHRFNHLVMAQQSEITPPEHINGESSPSEKEKGDASNTVTDNYSFVNSVDSFRSTTGPILPGTSLESSVATQSKDSIGFWKKSLVEFYEKHNPAKLTKIESILAKYNGEELLMMKRLHTKYNVPFDQSQYEEQGHIAQGNVPVMNDKLTNEEKSNGADKYEITESLPSTQLNTSNNMEETYTMPNKIVNDNFSQQNVSSSKSPSTKKASTDHFFSQPTITTTESPTKPARPIRKDTNNYPIKELTKEDLQMGAYQPDGVYCGCGSSKNGCIIS